jgi:hypothetical protein
MKSKKATYIICILSAILISVILFGAVLANRPTPAPEHSQDVIGASSNTSSVSGQVSIAYTNHVRYNYTISWSGTSMVCSSYLGIDKLNISKTMVTDGKTFSLLCSGDTLTGIIHGSNISLTINNSGCTGTIQGEKVSMQYMAGYNNETGTLLAVSEGPVSHSLVSFSMTSMPLMPSPELKNAMIGYIDLLTGLGAGRGWW